jgi:hypothetical protein
MQFVLTEPESISWLFMLCIQSSLIFEKKEDAMIEILCSRTNKQIQEINAAYKRG